MAGERAPQMLGLGDEPRVLSLPNGELALYCCADPTQAERAGEDRVATAILDDSRMLMTVADGAGGHQDGGAAAELAVETLAQSVVQAAGSNAELAAGILAGFEEANRRVLALGTGAATTLAAVVVEGRTLRTYHAGDSMVLVVGGRGAIRLQTVAHSPVGYALEAGLLEPAAAMHHDERHLVSNMVGTRDMHLEVHSPRKLRPRDTAVVATDGLYDNLLVEEICELVRRGPLGQAARALADACRQRMLTPVGGQPSKPDDLSFVLFRPARANH